MPKKYIVSLTTTERETLQAIIKKGKHTTKMKRAYVLLAADIVATRPALTDQNIHETYKASIRTIERLRERFVTEGFDIALNGRPSYQVRERKIDGEVEAHLIALTRSEVPDGHDTWTFRLLAEKMVALDYVDSISHESVRQILKKNVLKPHKRLCWVIPPQQNATFVYQMEQVLEVYKRPYEPKNPLLCLDEITKQLVSEVRQPIISANGTTLYDYEYHRAGTCDLFMVCEPLTGQRLVTVRDQHTRLDWARVVADLVEQRYPQADKITLVQDNLSAHQPSALYELFEPARAKWILDKVEFVFTPKHGSWLNIAEIELSVLARQCLSGRIGSKQRLMAKVALWQNRRNSLVVKVDWHFSTADARIKLKHLYPSIVT